MARPEMFPGGFAEMFPGGFVSVYLQTRNHLKRMSTAKVEESLVRWLDIPGCGNATLAAMLHELMTRESTQTSATRLSMAEKKIRD